MRILIAEDDPVSCRLLEATLVKWGHQVVVTHNGDEAWNALQRDDAPSLAIIDWMMPGVDGVEICRRTRAQSKTTSPYRYLVLLTAKTQTEDMIEGMNAGADDYITKPFEFEQLRVRLRAAKRILDLESNLLTTQKALRHQAMHDHLTGLWNRSAVIAILGRELARARREDRVVSVVVADIDHFKRVNDEYGHAAGDEILCQTARILDVNLREYDAVGRYGGEEFLIIMPGCDLENARRRADQLRTTVENAKILVSEASISLTLCMGVANSSGYATKEADAIIQAADAAMYVAKRNGRNRVELACDGIT